MADDQPRVFPLEPPDTDPRFTHGLAYDVRAVLIQHGYPEATGRDFVELQQALFKFLYAPKGDQP